MFQYPHRIVGGFKLFVLLLPFPAREGFSILIGSSGGSSSSVTLTTRLSWMFQYPHRIVGGFKKAHDSNLLETSFCFSILIGSSGGSSMVIAWLITCPCCFSILIGSSGGSSPPASGHNFLPTSFQYPHRIVGGFKFVHCGHRSLRPLVSVSSSDRRGVQAYEAVGQAVNQSKFQYPHRIVGGFKKVDLATAKFAKVCFSILIGSSGGSSQVAR